jgi:hypothetical protein
MSDCCCPLLDNGSQRWVLTPVGLSPFDSKSRQNVGVADIAEALEWGQLHFENRKFLEYPTVRVSQ